MTNEAWSFGSVVCNESSRYARAESDEKSHGGVSRYASRSDHLARTMLSLYVVCKPGAIE